MRSRVAQLAVLATCLTSSTPAARAEAPRYNRDIRPILSAHCFKCHGPDDQAREAGLRLDQRDAALATTESGVRPIVPGAPDDSELIRRIESNDPELVMPPPTANKPLSGAQKTALKDWIAAGAPYESHWSFAPPVQSPLPSVNLSHWPRNPIDHFILARLEADSLAPSPEADRYTLLRRLSLDLIGLPPTPAEIEAFLFDSRPDAYEALVDRLLSSPHYGERWARRWLDLARYADTNGYEKDRTRSIWPYRDWVIAALNADMPFDQFTIEQLAGDMLPDATISQRVATGFHRNTMLNEEGGVDPLEFRFHAMTDRVGVTSTVWLGLTVACAQCHTHKFDPIPHLDYYRTMAFLNNADEPELDVPTPDLTRQRNEINQQIAAIEADLANRFPPAGEFRWLDQSVVAATALSGATLEPSSDGSWRVTAAEADKDTYSLKFDLEPGVIGALQIEALTDPQLPHAGPGRAPNGNFVLTDVAISLAVSEQPDQSQPIAVASATADVAQDGFPIAHAIDDNPQTTGWAIHVAEPWNVSRVAMFRFAQPLTLEKPARVTVQLSQQYGGQHTLGRFRLRWGRQTLDDRPEVERRREHLDRRFREWLATESAAANPWTLLEPVAAHSEIPSLDILADQSVLASGDMSKRDIYKLGYRTPPNSALNKITALRLEALPDDSLPKQGPGRIAYEGPFGDFFLSEFMLRVGEHAIKIKSAGQSFANGANAAARTIDGDPQTGWSIDGGQGRSHTAVWLLEEPITPTEAFQVELLFERYYAAGMGRFKLWATDQPNAGASQSPTAMEAALATEESRRTPEQNSQLLKHYLSIAPELAAEHAKIRKLRDNLPAYPTSLVMRERDSAHPRVTRLHKRGEFLQPTEPVAAELPSLFAALPAAVKHDRLSFARWLASERNPLVARVAVNREWAAFFGRGIVRTTEDFGYQGELPTHPELLDWLAVQFLRDGWSLKTLHKLIVTSATYRQSSQVSSLVRDKDPQNRLLAHFPRSRLEAELIRDSLLAASDLLSNKIGGPSVFPPQPIGVTSEGTYGPVTWKVSEGADRYRRGLYTFSKRTAPFAMSLTFDAPSGEACLARREVSNTPLQALTLLNDAVSLEAAQALGKLLASHQTSPQLAIEQLFLRCVGRPPSLMERESLLAFKSLHQARITNGEMDAAAIAGEPSENAAQRALWTLTARVVLNLDESVTKE